MAEVETGDAFAGSAGGFSCGLQRRCVTSTVQLWIKANRGGGITATEAGRAGVGTAGRGREGTGGGASLGFALSSSTCVLGGGFDPPGTQVGAKSLNVVRGWAEIRKGKKRTILEETLPMTRKRDPHGVQIFIVDCL